MVAPQRESPESAPILEAMMTKHDTMEAIMRLNPTARPEFLAEFAADELRDYLRQLEGLFRRDRRRSEADGRLAPQPAHVG